MKYNQETRKSISRRPVSVFVLIAACLVCILATALIVRTIMYNRVGGRQNYDQVRNYLEIVNTIRDNYVNDFDESKINSTVGKAIVDSLGDKWSYYMSPEEYDLYKLSNENEYEAWESQSTALPKTRITRLHRLLPDLRRKRRAWKSA